MRMPTPKKLKFGNKKIDGFDSRVEKMRHEELALLERVGIITKLEKQPKFTLQKGFRDCQGKLERAIVYTADFMYVKDGLTVVEDVKSDITAKQRDFRIKFKLTKKQNPEIVFKVVKFKKNEWVYE